MKIKTASYMVKQGFVGLWRNRVMSMASVGSIASALVILGTVFIIILSMNNLAESAKSQFDSIQVYLQEDIEQSRIEDIGKSIKRIDGIRSVDFITQEEALEIMKEQWGEHGYLLEGLEQNPLQDYYVVELKDLSNADEVVSKLQGLQGLDEVNYYKDIVEKLLNIANIIRTAGLVIIGMLIIISMFVVSNTIKLTVIARYREINIMKYVGATNWFIRWPFLVEGSVLGFLGALIAILIVGFGYSSIFNYVTQKLYVMLTVYMIVPSVIIKSMSVIFIILGTGIGALGSIFSMRRFLKV